MSNPLLCDACVPVVRGALNSKLRPSICVSVWKHVLYPKPQKCEPETCSTVARGGKNESVDTRPQTQYLKAMQLKNPAPETVDHLLMV